MHTVLAEHWEQLHSDGVQYRPLGDDERALLAEHAPAPAGGARGGRAARRPDPSAPAGGFPPSRPC